MSKSRGSCKYGLLLWDTSSWQSPYCCFAPPSTAPHVVSVSGACLFGVVLIASACVFGLCWLGCECAWCRADGVPSAPCGSAVPSTLLSQRERRADRLLQGEHHFLSSSCSLTYTQNACIHITRQLLHTPVSHFFPLFLLTSNFPFMFLQRLIFDWLIVKNSFKTSSNSLIQLSCITQKNLTFQSGSLRCFLTFIFDNLIQVF